MARYLWVAKGGGAGLEKRGGRKARWRDAAWGPDVELPALESPLWPFPEMPPPVLGDALLAPRLELSKQHDQLALLSAPTRFLSTVP